ncbi:MAG: hypothetical protein U0105_17700 [Candidatus Obscuribacterales bacterium]
MSGTELLLALSARKKGSWRQFKDSVDALLWYGQVNQIDSNVYIDEQADFSIHQTVRFNLQRLCHAEFFAPGCERGWRVTPPVMAINKGDYGYEVILAGARSETQLYNLLGSSLGDFVEFTSFPACPDKVIIRFDDVLELERVGTSLGFRVQRAAPEVLLGALPIIPELPTSDDSGILPFGSDWKVEYLDLDARRWITAQSVADITNSLALCRFTGPFQTQLFAKQGARYSQLADLAIAKYQLLSRHRQQVFSYNEQTQILSVPAIFRPPLLVERGLILHSGELPAFRKQERVLEYSKISARAAKMVCALIKQELQGS